jgi:hypothetical protein
MRHLTENEAGMIFTELTARLFESVGVRNGTWGETKYSPQIFGQKKQEL